MANDQFGKKVQTQSNKEIYFISDYNDLDIKKVVISDAIILDYSNRDGCTSFVNKLGRLLWSPFILFLFSFCQSTTKLIPS